jgi:hypothetical protein
MSSVQSALAAQPKRQYVSSAAFNRNIFSYTLSTNPATNVTTGDLSANIVGANSTTCPAGRILRESGLKLYPGVNNGVNTYMVGVVDTVTLLAGYIDPNSPVFAVYSNQLPFMPPYGTNPNGVDPGPQGLPDEGPPVYTNGDVICVSGNIVAQTGSITSATDVNAGRNVNVIGDVSANSFIRSASYVQTTKVNISPADPSGQPSPGTGASAGSANLNGASPSYARIYTTALTDRSLVFVTRNNAGAAGAISVNPVVLSGYFDIITSNNGDNSTVYWFIIN